jgi:CheY-like chemotaxis protein/HPt (histidine-containing phosphotransfer) domain-containing protein
MKKILAFTIALAITGIELFGGEKNLNGSESDWLLIVVFILAAIGILVLFVYSSRISKMKKEYQKIEKNSKDLEEKQNELLAGMSTDIQKMVKQAIGSTSAIANKNKSNEINQELSTVLQTENQLLDIANDLIEFIHLKAKKVTITSNRYVLDNLLNDITGFISKNYSIKTLELTYKIDNAIPEELIGDTLKISKILYNLLDYSIRNGATKLLLHVNKAPGFQSENELTFSILANINIDVENDAFFFKTQYDEENNKYDSLGLFVAKELATLMNGELIARNDKNGKVEFIFSTSFLYPNDYSKKPIDNNLLKKKTLIVENNDQYASALKEMLKAYEHKVTTLSPKLFFEKEDVLQNYNLIILDEKIFTASVIKSLEKIDKGQDIKVIALSNFFNPVNSQYYTKIADHKLLKPTIRGTLRHLLETAYLSKEAQEVSQADKVRSTNLKIYRDEFAKTPSVTPETFTLFKDHKLLIVEDDAINQKVLQSVLRKSGMEIDVANNGEECLKLLKEKKHYDIILMDINMPTMDGYTATREIRSNSDYDSIPIIALTTLTSTDEINKMFNTGMNAHLAKPFHKENLFTAFDMYLKSNDEEVTFYKAREVEVTYPGLNIKQGISKVNNNEEFYKEILVEFLATYQNSAIFFEKLINDFRYEQVRMYCLDIKGLSGLIGATELHALMIEIHHQLIFKKFDMLDNYVTRFHETVSTVSKSIKEYIDS